MAETDHYLVLALERSRLCGADRSGIQAGKQTSLQSLRTFGWQPDVTV